MQNQCKNNDALAIPATEKGNAFGVRAHSLVRVLEPGLLRLFCFDNRAVVWKRPTDRNRSGQKVSVSYSKRDKRESRMSARK